ncbi:HAD family hydrolase [Duncaniella muricolitica]|jgi:HAD superfamily hydrolase (TIGR01509 family)|uniref:HAD family hydrolase n=1 Tax=Duncaniella muricolitica TaxID=2880704 RepID=UPI000F46F7C7|nr:HAD family phosphatase [Duncaniella muricolitica]ROT23699.1 HAD family phosphatase [Muribaculaceae bacterium Isolate-110 (HZI)]
MNNTYSKKGMLFDLDGVLVDSEGEYSKFWGAMGDRYGLVSTFASDIKGTTIGEILQNFPESDRDGILAALHEFEANMEYPVYPGVMEFLGRLKKAGIPSAIVTSSDNVKMDLLFGRRPELREMVNVVITGSMVSRSKPDPEGYLKGAELIGAPVEECCVFEDSLQGLQAGRSSGATVVGIATTNSREKVAPLADITVDRFEEILSLEL